MYKFLYLVLVSLIGVSAYAETLTTYCLLAKLEPGTATQTESAPGEIPYPQINTDEVIGIFKAAVNRGELILFENQVAYSNLKPQHVEYIYKIGETKPTIKVYSLLNKSMPLPAMPDIHVEGVTVILDAKGHIIEAVVHCHQ
ncbi:hypothetical protein [Kaarinaea lacus]